MPRTKKTGRKIEHTVSKEYETSEIQSVPYRNSFFPSPWFSLRNVILLGVLILAAIAWFAKGYFIVATVNGEPITRWELNESIRQRYAAQTLDTMIDERLILSESRKKNVYVNPEEIEKQIKELEGRMQGKSSLEEALALQGLTADMLRRQIEVQLSINKLFEKEASVSSQEIDEYIGKNKDMFRTATDPAKMRDEVTSMIKQQKVSDLFDTWFTDLRKQAVISKRL